MKYLLPFLLFFTTSLSSQAQSFTVEGPETICPGSSATLTAVGCAGTIRWNTGATTSSIRANSFATMTYEVTCTVDGTSTTARLTPIVAPNLQLVSTGNACIDNATLITATGVPNTARMRWYRDGVQIPNASAITYAPTQPGSYHAQTEVDGWSVQYAVPAGSSSFTSLDFVGTSVGWVGDAKGAMLKTVDGGKVWRPLSLQKVYAVDFVDNSTGYAVARGQNSAQALYKSIDGGTTWTEQRALPDSGRAALHFVSASLGWASNGSGTLYRTSDGGDTWNSTALGFSINSLFFLDATTGWAGGNWGQVARTTDGGLTWTVVQLPSAYAPITDLYFKNAQEGWISDGFETRTTRDGGVTWAYALFTGYPAQFGSLGFADADFGLALSTGLGPPVTEAKYYKTYDGGISWTQAAIPRALGLSKLKLVDKAHGWAIGSGQIMQYLAPSVSCNVNYLTYVNSPAAPVVTANGANEVFCAGSSILLTASGCVGTLGWSTGATTASITVTPPSPTLYTATCTANNGCQSRTNYSSGVVPQPTLSSNGPTCADANVQLTASGSGVVTTNLSWKRDGRVVAQGVDKHFANLAGTYTVQDTVRQGVWLPYASVASGQTYLSLSFADDTHGWAISGNKRLLKTTDGGNNWLPLTHSFDLSFYDGLADVEFKSPTLGWVSSQSKLFKTTDGGLTWTRQHTNVNLQFNDLFFLDDQLGWAAGADNSFYLARGYVLRTTDGGQTWQEAHLSQNSPIKRVQFVSASVGWAFGSNGYDLYKSTDGGATWQRQNLVSPQSQFPPLITSMDFQNPMQGWVGTATSLFKTQDGGTIWSEVALPSGSGSATEPYALDISNSSGWVLSKDAAYYTTDGGKSWSAHLYGGTNQSLISTFFFPTGKIIAMGSAGRLTKFVTPPPCHASLTILPAPPPPVVTPSTSLATALCQGQSITLAGGQCAGALSWSTGSTATSITVTMGSYSSTYTAYCTGSNGCKSTTYTGLAVLPKPTLATTAPAPCNRPVLTASFDSPQQPDTNIIWKRNGVLIENQHSTQYTVQRSGSYTAETGLAGVWAGQSPANFNVYALHNVQFVTNENGFAAGVTYANEPIFLSTSDGGKQWYPQFLPLVKGFNPHELFFVDAMHGWIMGELNSNPTSTDLLRTTDGGKSWKTTKIPTKYFSTLFFINASTGWIAGDSGKIWKTTDGGATWVSQRPFQNQVIVQTIFFWDTLRGWAGTSTGTLLSTNDGGATWTPLPSSEVTNFQSLQFTSATEGWAVSGTKNGLYRTSDGGTTWQKVGFDVSSNNVALGVQFVNDSTGFVTGDQYIHATTDWGATWNRAAKPFSLNAVSFTDATHGWAVGFSISTYKPALPGCASAGVEIPSSAIAPLSTLASGTWDTPAVWSCGSIPTALDPVRISDQHTVYIPAHYEAKSKSIELLGNIQQETHSNLQLGQK
jgi:photosystem II stability/assembly factor-like uncharacterized protein